MSVCEKYVEKILLSIDGALNEAEEEELQAHLSVCDGCRSLYLTYKNIDSGILGMEEEVPEGLSGAVMQAIRREKEQSKPVYFLKRAKFTLIAAAACLVLVIAGRSFDFSGNVSESAPVYDTEAETMQVQDTAVAAVPETAEEPAAFIVPRTGEEVLTAAQAEAAEEMPDETLDEAFSVGDGLDEIRSILAQLESAGYSGDLVQLFDSDEETLYDTFVTCEEVVLDDGTRLYCVKWDEFDAVADQFHYGYIFSTSTIGQHAFLWLN